VKFDPYDTLGLSREATDAEIKKAFRKRARETHPDVGGKLGEFEKVSMANIVLSDPDKRKKYDETGQVDPDQPDNSMSVALNIIIGFFAMTASGFAAGTGIDPCTVDLLDYAKKHFNGQITEFTKQKKNIQTTVDTLKRIEKRLKSKKNGNPILRVAILNQAQSAQQPLAQLEKQIKEHTDAVDLLNGYSFDAEMAKHVQNLGSGFFAFTGTGV